jgi:hypothetical protein
MRYLHLRAADAKIIDVGDRIAEQYDLKVRFAVIGCRPSANR